MTASAGGLVNQAMNFGPSGGGMPAGNVAFGGEGFSSGGAPGAFSMAGRRQVLLGQETAPVNVKAAIPAGLTAIPAGNLSFWDLRKGDLVYRRGVDRGQNYEHLMKVTENEPEVLLQWVASVDPYERGGAGRIPAAEKQDPLLRGIGEVTIYRNLQTETPTPWPWIIGGTAVAGAIAYAIYNSR